MKIFGNYHTHTYRCKHATGDAEDYADAARDLGLAEIGISDHTPLPDGWMPSVRMNLGELDGYTAAIEEAQARSGPSVLKGMECDLNPAYYSFYEDELLGRRGYSYLIGALHWYRHMGEWLYVGEVPDATHLAAYVDQIVRGMRRGIFAFFAHPDHFAASWKSWDGDVEAASRDLLEAASETGAVLEINGNGLRKKPVDGAEGGRAPYPWAPFWALAAEYGVRAICNSDAHRPEDIIASIDECRELAQRVGVALVDRP